MCRPRYGRGAGRVLFWAPRIGAGSDIGAGVAELSVPGATVAGVSSSSDVGKVRYTYRLRMSGTAQQALLAEWDRCR